MNKRGRTFVENTYHSVMQPYLAAEEDRLAHRQQEAVTTRVPKKSSEIRLLGSALVAAGAGTLAGAGLFEIAPFEFGNLPKYVATLGLGVIALGEVIKATDKM